MKVLIGALAFTLVSALGVSGAVEAKGTVKGAVVGAAAGHMVGHGHAVAGTAAGAAIGHHHAKVKARRAAERRS